MNRFLSILSEAQQLGSLVRIGRHRLEPRTAYSLGYVVMVSERLVLLNKVSDRIDLDGFEILRARDITSVATEFTGKEFYSRALELKTDVPQKPGSVDLSDFRTAIGAVAEFAPLIVVNREEQEPNEVMIGRPQELRKTAFKLHLINPAAEWTEDLVVVKYTGITKLEFGGEYENTLALVANANSASEGVD
jgi:hypothetical protein